MRTILAIMLASLPCVAQGQPSNNPVPRSPGAATKKELPERYHVMEAALRYMLKAHSSHGVERDYYSAYVLPKDGEFTPELVVAFAGYKPPVTADIEVSTGKGEARDKATGKRVKLWSGKVTEIHGDRATAYVSWYVAPLGAGGHTLHLRRKDGKWIVESEKMDWVS